MQKTLLVRISACMENPYVFKGGVLGERLQGPGFRTSEGIIANCAKELN